MRRSILGTACLCGMLLPAGLRADDFESTITVQGSGKVSTAPDMATVNTGVITEGATAGAALDDNNEAMQAVIAVLKRSQIADKDIQTSGFNVSPVYQRDRNNPRENTISGYRVSNNVRVKVRDLSKLGSVLDALVKAGSNQLSGVSFGVDDPTGVLQQARSRAIRDARSRAAVYAQAAEVEVGRVLAISEVSIPQPRPMMMGRMMAMEAAGSVPVQTGEQDFEVTVNVVYELKN